jgi:hypothetical protein
MRRALTTTMVALLGALGCSGSTDPESSDGPYVLFSRRLDGIEVDLSASSTTVAPGETVQLTVTAHNSGRRRIQLSVPCGPPMDAVIRSPSGQRVSVLNEMLGGNGAFTCELGERHFADPGETEVVRLTWRAPSQQGSYTAVGGLRGDNGQLHTLSATVSITVR